MSDDTVVETRSEAALASTGDALLTDDALLAETDLLLDDSLQLPELVLPEEPSDDALAAVEAGTDPDGLDPVATEDADDVLEALVPDAGSLTVGGADLHPAPNGHSNGVILLDGGMVLV